jgi:hypothetical protein
MGNRKTRPIVAGFLLGARIWVLFLLVQLAQKGSSQAQGVNLTPFNTGSARLLYRGSS